MKRFMKLVTPSVHFQSIRESPGKRWPRKLFMMVEWDKPVLPYSHWPHTATRQWAGGVKETNGAFSFRFKRAKMYICLYLWLIWILAATLGQSSSRNKKEQEKWRIRTTKASPQSPVLDIYPVTSTLISGTEWGYSPGKSSSRHLDRAGITGGILPQISFYPRALAPDPCNRSLM